MEKGVVNRGQCSRIRSCAHGDCIRQSNGRERGCRVEPLQHGPLGAQGWCQEALRLVAPLPWCGTDHEGCSEVWGPQCRGCGRDESWLLQEGGLVMGTPRETGAPRDGTPREGTPEVCRWQRASRATLGHKLELWGGAGSSHREQEAAEGRDELFQEGSTIPTATAELAATTGPWHRPLLGTPNHVQPPQGEWWEQLRAMGYCCGSHPSTHHPLLPL